MLTNREREVVALVAHGLSNDEIAERMVLSPMTAKTHVSRAMTKLAPATGPSSWCSPTSPDWSHRRSNGAPTSTACTSIPAWTYQPA